MQETNFSDSILISSWLLSAATMKHSKLELQRLINFGCWEPVKVDLLSDAFLRCCSDFIPLYLFLKETYRTLEFDFKSELHC